MKPIVNNADSLRKAIKELEQEQLNQKKQLTHHVTKKIESYKPVNILKSSVNNISGKSLKKTGVIAGAGLGAAFLLRKFLFKKPISLPLTLLTLIGRAAINSAFSSSKNRVRDKN